MNFSAVWGVIKKVLPPILVVAVAVSSDLLGRLINHWFFNGVVWIGPWLILMFSVGCGLIVLLSYWAHELYSDNAGGKPSMPVDSHWKYLVLSLTLGVVLCLETLGIAIEIWLQPWIQDFSLAKYLAVGLLMAIMALSLAIRYYWQYFRGIFFGKEGPRSRSGKGIGLIVPLSMPRSIVGNELPYWDSKTSPARLDVQDLLARFEGKSLSEIGLVLQASKKAGSSQAELGDRSSDDIMGEQLQGLQHFNWAMMLVALGWLKSQNYPQKRLHFLASEDGEDPSKSSSLYLAHAVQIAQHFGLEATTSSVNFDDIEAVYNEIKGVVNKKEWRGMDPVIDVTGGTKPIVIAGSAVAAHINNCQIVYVDTNTLKSKAWNPESRDSQPGIAA